MDPRIGTSYVCVRTNERTNAGFAARVDRLVNKRDETIANDGAVSLPIVAVLFSARFTVASVAMDEENAEIYDVKVRNEVGKAARETPRPRHDPVAEVVDVAADAPPTADDQLCTSRRLQSLQVRDSFIRWVGAEQVLLRV